MHPEGRRYRGVAILQGGTILNEGIKWRKLKTSNARIVRGEISPVEDLKATGVRPRMIINGI